MNGLPLICGDDVRAPLAWRAGQPISRGQYLADVQALASRLPEAGPMLNLTADRYRFAVGLGAAMLRGQHNLLPPNHTSDTVARLLEQFPGTYALADAGAPAVRLPTHLHPMYPMDHAPLAEPPRIADHALAAQVLTSGSTGAPQPHPKHWGLLVRNAQGGAQRLAQQIGRQSLAGVTIVATVPAQHMYGFESSVLVALVGGAAFDTERPFYPADIVAALTRAAPPRVLVTTPFHLKMLLESGLALPPVDLVVSATAPLSPQLAARAESALGGALMEIYGCTEAGQVASRRTTAGPEWRVYEGLRLSGDGDQAVVQGGHVPQPTVLADVLEVLDAQTFRLLGRSNDLVNMAGKRSSLSHLNHHLNTIAGVQDGVFWLPHLAENDAKTGNETDSETVSDAGGVVRLVAFVVAPGIAHQSIVAALRAKVDAAFLPRRLVDVASLPREATGKLPAAVLDAWAPQQLALARRGAS